MGCYVTTLEGEREGRGGGRGLGGYEFRSGRFLLVNGSV